MAEQGIEVWASEEWRARATTWLDEQLARAGIARTGPVEQPHLRPWATALRAPTAAGPVWLKAPGPGTAFEVGLYEVLHRLAPGHVLEPIAVDADRSWVVLPDGGATLRHAASADGFAAFLPQYAELQRRLASHVDELIGVGVADMRPALLPRRFEEALATVRDRADPAVFRRLAALRDRVDRLSAELAAAPGGASIDHNDLHAGNVFLDDGGRARFYDWGDSVVAHPFASLLVPLEWARKQQPGVRERLRDAYLEVWTDLAPRAELVAAAELASALALIARTLVWERAGGTADEFASAPLETLAGLASILD